MNAYKTAALVVLAATVCAHTSNLIVNWKDDAAHRDYCLRITAASILMLVSLCVVDLTIGGDA